jgi:hypothetical protein
LRFNHRKSIDIDLFCHDIIGFKGFGKIKQEVTSLYPKTDLKFQDPMNINRQFTFLRFFIPKNDIIIKVELIQNMKLLDNIENIKGLRLVSVRDIGLFKLMSASTRSVKKDVYDLYYITRQIPIVALYTDLGKKYSIFNKKEHQNIFDIDAEKTVLNDPHRLLLFEKANRQTGIKMIHSHDNIIQMEHAASWQQARLGWRRQVRSLCEYLKKDF